MVFFVLVNYLLYLTNELRLAANIYAVFEDARTLKMGLMYM